MPSQRASLGSNPGPSRRRRRDASSDSEEEDAGERSTQQGSQTNGASGGEGSGLKQIHYCADQLVRVALFHEYQRKALRRDYIFQKIVPQNAKGSIHMIFHRAQTILRQKFGMELYELRKSGKGAGSAGMEATQTQTQAQTQRPRKRGRPSGLNDIAEEEEEEDEEAEGEETQATQSVKPSGSKTYILRSILSPEIREMMAEPLRLNTTNNEDNDDDHVDTGALIPFDKADGSATGSIQLLGVRTVILCLVLCMGRVIADDHLHSLLKRLNLHGDTILPYTSPDGKDAMMTLDKYLDLLHRQQYLEKVKIVGQVGPGDSAAFEWRWGSREAEFSEKAMQEWMIRLMAGEDEEQDEEEPRDRRERDARRKREEERASKLKNMRQDIVKAAGGPLTGDL